MLGDCTSKAREISARASQYQQHALISYFPDFANLSEQEEAALATNSIDDRSEKKVDEEVGILVKWRDDCS